MSFYLSEVIDMKTILVVDDEPRTVEPLKKILERAGYNVETAVNKAQAEEKGDSHGHTPAR